MSKIKNLIFDLGGVLLNIDYTKTSVEFKKLGVLNFDELYSQSGANHLFEALETGEISEENFYTTMLSYCNSSTTKEQVELAWNAMLLTFRKDSLDYLKELKSTYNIYLLSNTNSIHLTAFSKILQNQIGGYNLDDYFITAYYSHIIRKRKPYPSTYHFVLNDANLIAANTLFIDDSINNIEGAKEADLQVYHLTNNKTIRDINL